MCWKPLFSKVSVMYLWLWHKSITIMQPLPVSRRMLCVLDKKNFPHMYFFFFLYIEQSIHFHYSIQMESIIFFLRKFCTWQTMWNPFLNLIMYKRIHSLCVQFFCCTIHNFRRCSADGRALAVHREFLSGSLLSLWLLAAPKNKM